MMTFQVTPVAPAENPSPPPDVICVVVAIDGVGHHEKLVRREDRRQALPDFVRARRRDSVSVAAECLLVFQPCCRSRVCDRDEGRWRQH